ncbi:M57 family metalloprotease [Pedobacter sp. D749]|uniref:M57 family metalloprotease n=1 Tax=Pedobacter sp. D749 TaxID=2856523 RepID=UPI001C5995FD|nr:M57 family metalloprotease [Pedobacter sp. D749]QXU43059.1 zinc-dependent metalloprotease [Pedobacter sp. D749]
MKKTIYHLTLFFTIILIFLTSCSKRDSQIDNIITNDVLGIREKVALLGFDTTNMIINNKIIVVEGDIVLTKDNLIKATPRQATSVDLSNGGYPINYSRHRDLKYYIDPTLSSWVTGIESAFNNYIGLSEVNLRFTRTLNVNEADLRIEQGLSPSSPSGAVADAYFPSNGLIGFRIGVNTSFSSLSDSQKTFVISHEVGHTIGFRHTNWFATESANGVNNGITVGAYTIPGTPNSGNNPDPNSVFNSGAGLQQVPNWTNFSSFDLAALKTLYPRFGFAELTTSPNGSFPVSVGTQISASVYIPNWREGGLTYEWFVQGATIVSNNGSSIEAIVTDANSAGIYCKVTNNHGESTAVSRSFGSIAID